MSEEEKRRSFGGELCGAGLDHLMAALHVAPVAAVLSREDGSVVDCNDAMLALMRLPRSEVARVNTHRFYAHPSERAELLQELAGGGQVRGKTMTFRRADESLVLVAVSVSRFVVDGSPMLVAFLHQEERAAEAQSALAETEARYRLLFEDSGVYTSIFDKDGVVLLFNSLVAELFGGSPEDFVGRRFVDLHPDVGAVYEERIAEVISSGGRHEYEDLVQFPTGERWLISVVHPARDAAGRAYGVQIVSQDITERKRAEEQRAILEEQLRHAQKMEAIGRLAGGVAHDFNNLLTGIIGFSEGILLRLKPEDESYDALQSILDAGLRAASLTRQLTAFSRKQVIDPTTIDINVAVKRSMMMLSRIIGEEVRLRFEAGDGVWPVEIDPDQVDQILTNLATNARDAMAEGGRLSIRTTNTTLDSDHSQVLGLCSPGDYVELAVGDDGAGMDEVTTSLIFEPFFTTKPRGKGTGLGLSTVYGIARQNSGAVAVTSSPGQGTTFSIFLPRAVGTAEADATPTPSGVVSTGRGETILVVEDDTMVRALAKQTLQSHGYEVLVASDGPSALALMEDLEGGVDLLLTDVVMPGINGKQLHDELRKTSPSLPVVFMSGYAGEVVARKGVLSVDSPLIPKPFERELLCSTVRRVLDRRES